MLNGGQAAVPVAEGLPGPDWFRGGCVAGGTAWLPFVSGGGTSAICGKPTGSTCGPAVYRERIKKIFLNTTSWTRLRLDVFCPYMHYMLMKLLELCVTCVAAMCVCGVSQSHVGWLLIWGDVVVWEGRRVSHPAI